MASVAPTQDTLPVAGTTAGEFSFDSAVTWLSIRNHTGQTIYILFNRAADGTDATTTVADLELEDGERFLGQCMEIGPLAVSDYSVWIPTAGTVGQLYVRGG